MRTILFLWTLVLALGGALPGPSPAMPSKASFLLVFQDNGKDPGIIAHRLARRTGTRVLWVYRHALRGCALAGVSDEDAAALARDPEVRSIQRDRSVRAAGQQTAPPWGLDRVDQRDLPLDLTYNYSGDGTGVRAYILDTGIRITHTQFGGRASNGWDFVENDAVAQDGHGHGTHVAGIVGGTTYGVAKNVSLVAVRVLDNAGQGSVAGVIAGVDWVTANAVKPAVANMSLTGLADAMLDAAVQNSIAAGIPYCVAAGNGTVVGVIGIPIIGTPQDASLQSPARVPEALTVGATDITDAEAAYSNFGSSVDLLAPGDNIASAWNTGDSDSATASGTSMATPHVAGAVALLLQASPLATPAQVSQTIKATATPGRITGMSSPLTPNLLLYTANTGAGILREASDDDDGCGLVGLEMLFLLIALRRRLRRPFP